MITGKMYKAKVRPTTYAIREPTIEWCNCICIKYLGIYLVSSREVKFDINPIKRCFMQLATVYSPTVKDWKR